VGLPAVLAVPAVHAVPAVPAVPAAVKSTAAAGLRQLDCGSCSRPANKRKCLLIFLNPSGAGEEMVCVPISLVKEGALTGSAGVSAGKVVLKGWRGAAVLDWLHCLLSQLASWQRGCRSCQPQQ
jgi:hypothetical protein